MAEENKELGQIKAERKELARVRSFWCVCGVSVILLVLLVVEIAILVS